MTERRMKIKIEADDGSNPIVELLDRVRRIETRLTAGLESLGATVRTQKPVWGSGVIAIPSLDARLKDIIDAVPVGYTERVVVFHQGVQRFSFFLD